MTRDQIEELAALDALSALEGEDLAIWERLRGEDPSALRLRDELAGAAAQLSLLAPAATAPSALRQRVMDRVFGGQPSDKTVTEAVRPFGFAAWAAAAAIVLLVLVGASATTRQKESVVVRDARPDPQNLQIALEGYGDYAKAKAHVLWDSGQRGWYVQAGGLPVLPATHSYHVWAVDADGAVHDCGELAVREGGLARSFVQPGDGISSMQGFAVTIEPVGSSSPAPTSPAVLISALQG
jgi:anti-sigma-K factor RskA